MTDKPLAQMFLVRRASDDSVIGWAATREVAEQIRQEIAWAGIATKAPWRPEAA